MFKKLVSPFRPLTTLIIKNYPNEPPSASETAARKVLRNREAAGVVVPDRPGVLCRAALGRRCRQSGPGPQDLKELKMWVAGGRGPSLGVRGCCGDVWGCVGAAPTLRSPNL